MKLKFGVLAITLLLGVNGAFAQDKKGIGARFDTRDPTSCASRKEPATGALTAAQVKQYWLCEAEVMEKAGSPENDQLWLATNATVELGKGRPFNIRTDSGYREIDPSQTVYPIRGSYTQWRCASAHPCCGIGIAPGKNCAKGENPAATGMCFKTSFGDWRCVLSFNGNMEGAGMYSLPGPKGN